MVISDFLVSWVYLQMGYRYKKYGYITLIFFHTTSKWFIGIFFDRGPVWSSGYDASLMRRTWVQYLGATLGGQAGSYSTPAVKGMS